MSTAVKMTTYRGTTNRNARGGSDARRRRREWLVETYRADVDVLRVFWPSTLEWSEHDASQVTGAMADRKEVVPACRCYRCGKLLTVNTVTVDRIKPGCEGGTYVRSNIRPACGGCNSETGGTLGNRRKAAAR